MVPQIQQQYLSLKLILCTLQFQIHLNCERRLCMCVLLVQQHKMDMCSCIFPCSFWFIFLIFFCVCVQTLAFIKFMKINSIYCNTVWTKFVEFLMIAILWLREVKSMQSGAFFLALLIEWISKVDKFNPKCFTMYMHTSQLEPLIYPTQLTCRTRTDPHF